MATRNQSVRELNAKAELVRAQQSREKWEGVWRGVAVIGPAALKYGCIAWGLSQAAKVLIAWTGSTTHADVKLNFVTDVLSGPQAGILLPWSVVIAVFLLYRREKSLKEKALERLGEANRKLELLSDPDRSSSQLPPSGQTNPRDMP